jgi:H+/gluconate symporter-like permease
MGLLGIILALGLLIWLACKGWSVLLLALAAALLAAAAAKEPLPAHWTQTFMGSAAVFVAQFFPLFLLSALFGKLMPAAIAFDTSTFTMSALPGIPVIQNATPMPFFGSTLDLDILLEGV